MRARNILYFSVTLLCSEQGFEVHAKKTDGKCRILSLRGGGIHGSFEVGVLKGLVDLMPHKEIKYDYIAGVSIGAYNAAQFATFQIGSEKEAVEYML